MTALLLTIAMLSANHAKQPDLVVRGGAVSSTHGRVTGSFAVGNAGRRRAPRFSVVLRAGDTTLETFTLAGLRRSASRAVKVSAAIPAGLPAGSLALRVCVDPKRRVREGSERNNCRRLATLVVAARPSSSPSDPVSFKKDEVLAPGGGRTYWTYVPHAYDASHRTPISLLVWLHGCGGKGAFDIGTIDPGGDQSYLSIAVDGREQDCWQVDEDVPKVLDAIANVKTHFNIDPRRVVIGGFSSGGDLAYRTAFYNADTFAGLLAENTAPFRDTGSTQQQSLAAASWKFNVVHLAHTGDQTYGVDEVRPEIKAMQDAGFPVTFVERAGAHGDDTTDRDLVKVLLPHMTDPWLAP